MTSYTPSLLSLAASAIYALVAITCAAAATTAIRQRQLPGHWRTWLIISLFFSILIVLRLVAAEEWMRDYLRGSLKEAVGYDDRRSVQAPIVAAIFAIAGTAAFLLFYRWTKIVKGRRNLARVVAVAAALSMVCLIGLRMTSLHMVDGLLYGPAKLNWVIDLGASLVVIIAAITYIRLVRQRP